MKKVYACGIITVLCIVAAVLLRIPMSNAELDYEKVDVKVVSSETKERVVKTGYSQSTITTYDIVVSYMGKNYDLEKSQAMVFASGSKKMENLEHSWKSIYYDDVMLAYSEMGWKWDAKMEGAENFYDKGGFLYCGVAFPDIYEKIQTVEDNVEFSYAVLSVVRGVDIDCSLYTEFVKKLHKGLKEYELFSVIDMIGREQKKKVFIAMNFDDSMKKARNAIVDAIKSFNYDPMLIDNKEHNNQIVPEIYKEISDSIFVIADLTGQRGGVYYEAGYAVEIGRAHV